MCSVLTGAAALGHWSEQPPAAGLIEPDDHVNIRVFEVYDGSMHNLYTMDIKQHVHVSTMAAGALQNLGNMFQLHVPKKRVGVAGGHSIIYNDYKPQNTLYRSWRLRDCFLVQPIFTDLSLANKAGTCMLRFNCTPTHSCKRLQGDYCAGKSVKDKIWTHSNGPWPLHQELLDLGELIKQKVGLELPCLEYTLSDRLDDYFAWAVCTADELTVAEENMAAAATTTTSSSSSSSSSSAFPPWVHTAYAATTVLRNQLRECLHELECVCKYWQLTGAWLQAAQFVGHHGLGPVQAPKDEWAPAAAPAVLQPPPAAAAAVGSPDSPGSSGATQAQQQGTSTAPAYPAVRAGGSSTAQQQAGSSDGTIPFQPYTVERANQVHKAAEQRVHRSLKTAAGLLGRLLQAIPDLPARGVYIGMATGKLPQGEFVCRLHSNIAHTCLELMHSWKVAAPSATCALTSSCNLI
jgi:hypothetical protein